MPGGMDQRLRHKLMRALHFAVGLLCSAVLPWPALGAIALKSTGTPTFVTNGTTTADLGSTPTAVGDVTIVFAGLAFDEASGPTSATPASFTSLAANTLTNGHIRISAAASGTADADVSVSLSSGTASSNHMAVGLVLSGAQTTIGSLVHASATVATTGATTSINTPALTISNPNTYVCLFLVDAIATTSHGDYNPNGSGNWGQVVPLGRDTDNQSIAVSAYCELQTTATNITASAITVQNAGTRNARATIISFNPAASGPTFTSAPAIGTRTTSSIPISFTSDTTGTVYGARLTDGSATPTCDQLEAQTATGGVQYFSEAVTATVADAATFGSITDGSVTDGYFCVEDGSGNDSAVASIANMYKLPAFAVTPTVSAQDDNDYTITKTLDGAGTVYAVACKAGETAPTVTQVEAGNCTGNVAAIAATNDDASGTFTLGGSLTRPIHSLYVVGTYGSQHEASVHTLANEILDAPANYQHVQLTGIVAGSFLEAITSPSVAVSDIPETYLATDPDNYAITLGVDGDLYYAGPPTRQVICYRVYDYSVGDWMSITSPSPLCAGTRAALILNGQDPVCGAPSNLNLQVGEASQTIEIANGEASECSDPQGDTLTCAVTSGTLPNPLALVSCAIASAEPTTEDLDGETVEITVTNEVGATAVKSITYTVYDEVEMPDCVTGPLLLSQCLSFIDQLPLVEPDVLIQGACSDQPSTTVLSQDPAAGEPVEEEIALTYARRCGTGGGRRTLGVGIGVN